MKVLSWILCILSFLAIPIFAIVGATGMIPEKNVVDTVIIGVIVFFILGFISHAFISFSKGKGSKDGRVLFILTYPAFIVPVGFILFVLYVISMIDWVIYIWTGKRYIAGVINWVKSIISPYKSTNKPEKKSNESQEVVFVVMDGSWERKLKYTSWQGKQLKTDYNEKSPYYMQTYQIFVDDLGNIWRSYDGAKTFIKEERGEIVR